LELDAAQQSAVGPHWQTMRERRATQVKYNEDSNSSDNGLRATDVDDDAY
jgi:hypothetical protein